MSTPGCGYYFLDDKISITRQKKALSPLMGIFELLEQLSWPEILVFCPDKKTLIKQVKLPEEIIIVDFDFNSLYNKFIDWSLSSKKPVWHLTAEETALLKLSCNAAYYYYIIQGYNTISKSQHAYLVEFFNFLFDFKVTSLF